MTRASKRIILDYTELLKEPIDQIYYNHDEDNLFKGYACIIGPSDTPYEKGHYLFEFSFPENYPFSPPKVKFITYDGFTRFNPNLYINGYVCLSVLNTWEGEKWSSCQCIRSVLVILSTLLNETPLLNEPGILISHPDFNNYNEIIEYKNIEISILKYLDKTNLPYSFQKFHPVLINNFKKNYQYFVDKCKNKQDKHIQLSIYHNMSVFLEYSSLLYKINTIYNNL
jgi:ubiquitin-conjugating enzyme E2 Z